jgi:hypothetical protein
VRTIVIGDLRNISGLYLLIAGRRHFERGGEICPELKPVRAARTVSLRHFLVNDAASCRHPLNLAGANRSAIPQAVLVIDGSGEHIGDGFDASMRMPREAGRVVFRGVAAKLVEEQKRVKLRGASKPKGAVEMHSCSFELRPRSDQFLNGPQRH